MIRQEVVVVAVGVAPGEARPSRPRAGRFRYEGALFAAFVVLTAVLAAGLLLDLDLAVRDWCDTHRPRPPYLLARGLNFLGSANLIAPIALVIASFAALRARTVRPVLLVLVTFAAAYLLIAPIKMLANRAAPHSPIAHPVELFHHPPGWSYPSGHVANTVYLFGVLLAVTDVLTRRLWGRPLGVPVRLAVRVAPPVVVSATTTYLGFHWLTDAAAGLLLGLLVDRLLWRLPWDLPPPTLSGDDADHQDSRRRDGSGRASRAHP
jgi:membrane-associated phospholipid phosphatase